MIINVRYTEATVISTDYIYRRVCPTLSLRPMMYPIQKSGDVQT